MFQEKIQFKHELVGEAGFNDQNGYNNIRHKLIVITTISQHALVNKPNVLVEIKKECLNIINKCKGTEFYIHIYDNEWKAVYHSDRILRW